MALYTNIPYEEGIERNINFLKKHNAPDNEILLVQELPSTHSPRRITLNSITPPTYKHQELQWELDVHQTMPSYSCLN